jgi:putative SOS response-associated peptidase YedK
MHDRMPVIIQAKDYDHWLKSNPDRPPIDLLRPFDAKLMRAWRVDRKVGNVKYDSPELIEEVAAPETLFK